MAQHLDMICHKLRNLLNRVTLPAINNVSGDSLIYGNLSLTVQQVFSPRSFLYMMLPGQGSPFLYLYICDLFLAKCRTLHFPLLKLIWLVLA